MTWTTLKKDGRNAKTHKANSRQCLVPQMDWALAAKKIPLMEKQDITIRTLRMLKKTVLLQKELFEAHRDLTAEGNGDYCEYFAPAAFEIGIGLAELESLFNTLGHRLPWQKYFKE